MTHPRTGVPRARRGVRAHRPAVVALVVAFGVGGASLPAEAATTPTGSAVMARPADHSDNASRGDIVGNGRNNRNLVTINSPALTHGNQTFQNANVGGSTPSQAAFCKWRRHHCTFHQKMVLWIP